MDLKLYNESLNHYTSARFKPVVVVSNTAREGKYAVLYVG